MSCKTDAKNSDHWLKSDSQNITKPAQYTALGITISTDQLHKVEYYEKFSKRFKVMHDSLFRFYLDHFQDQVVSEEYMVCIIV